MTEYAIYRPGNTSPLLPGVRVEVLGPYRSVEDQWSLSHEMWSIRFPRGVVAKAYSDELFNRVVQ
jgi:hypothetical protein